MKRLLLLYVDGEMKHSKINDCAVITKRPIEGA